MALRSAAGWVGRPLPRFEDARLVAGGGRYVDDIAAPDALHAVFLRSPHRAARLVRCDLTMARAQPGVVAVLTGADLGELPDLPPNPLIGEIRAPRYRVLAQDRVAAVGQPVALVVATSRAAALDALERIELGWEPEAPVDRPPAFARRWAAGDAAAGFTAAAAVVGVEIEHARVAPTALEPRAALARWSAADGSLSVWLSTQTPHRSRQDIARLTGLAVERVRVVAPDVGGAFGGKASIYPEELAVAIAAVRLRRTVRWTAERGEELLAATHGRGLRCRGRLALAADGRFLALEATLDAPLGHWLPFSAAAPAWNAGRILPGPYRLDSVDITVTGRCTPTTPVGIHRGAGRPEAAMLMERLADLAAHTLAMDPAELRRRNLLESSDMPAPGPTGRTLDSGDPRAVMERALALADYAGRRAEQARRRAQGEHVGIGVAVYVEPCGQGWERAAARLERDGRITVVPGSTAQGQGRATAARQLAADLLRCDPAQLQVALGDTDDLTTAVGALASRSTPIGGSALLLAVEALVEAARERAAELCQTASAALELDGMGFHLRTDPSRRIDWPAIAAASPPGDGPALRVERVYEAAGEAWGLGCHLAVVAVDSATGVVRVERLVCVDDAGTIVNPLLAEGQILGGVAQGLGEALMERIVHDAEGQLLTGSLMDYALPRAADMPPVAIATLVSPTPLNPLGAKGVGEAGTIGAPAAILNAVLDALAPLGVTSLDPPLTSEQVWRAIRAAGGGRERDG